METFKDIIGYEGYYQVSNYGNIKSLQRIVPHKTAGKLTIKERILKPCRDSTGYLSVKLCNHLKLTPQKVHILVAKTFLNHNPCRHQLVIDHIDNNKLNNRLDNIQIVTVRFNNSKDKKGTSKYTGVRWDKKRLKWRTDIRIDKIKKYLGHFDNEIDASNAYVNKLNQI